MDLDSCETELSSSIAISHIDGYSTLNTAYCIRIINKHFPESAGGVMLFLKCAFPFSESVVLVCASGQLVQIHSCFPKTDG